MADLLSQPAVLSSVDLNGAAAACLGPAFAVLKKVDRRRIEQAILGLCDATDPPIKNQGNRLLSSLPIERMVTEAARRAWLQRKAESRPEPLTQGSAGRAGDGQWPEAPDGNTDTPSDRAVRQRTEGLAGLMRGSDGRPLDVSNAKLAAGIRAVQGARQKGAGARVPERLLHEADARMAEAAERILMTWPLRPASGPVRLAREVALASAQHELPVDDLDDTDEDLRSWGWPAVRRDAVEALALLTREPKVATDATRSAIRRLVRDPSAIVRDGLASRLDCVLSGDEGLAWELAERIAREEQSSAVQGSMLSSAMSGLLHRDEDRAVALLAEMSRRERKGRQ